MSTTRVSRAAVGAVALLLAGVLAGCDDENPPEPQGPIESSSEPTSPSTSSTGATSSTSTDAGTVRPPADAVRAWISAYNAASRSGDTSAAAALTGRNCSTCDELLSSVEEVTESGGYFRGGRWTVDAARVTHRAQESVTVTAGITAAPGSTKSSSDSPPESYPLERFALEFQVSVGAPRTVITSIVFLS